MLYKTLRFLYTALLYLIAPLIFIRLWWRGRLAPEYRERWQERMGKLRGQPKKGGILIHAVSVGETEAAKPLVKALLAAYPNSPISLTCMTPTGSARIQSLFPDSVFHTYLPYDWPFVLRGFLKKIEPKVVCIMETELWPNLLAVCEELKIPVLLINGRLSERSARGYQSFGYFTKTMFQQLAHIAAQSPKDAERFQQSGAKATSVTVTGNIKYDIQVEKRHIEFGQQLRAAWQEHFVLVAASTHEGEEALLLPEFLQLRQLDPQARLILVPRHPERFDKVFKEAVATGLSVERRSQNETPSSTADIFIGDSMGELMTFYAASDVAFVGGSLVETGGHNPLEPAVVGVPIIMGPHRFNFAAISKTFEDKEAMLTIDSVSELSNCLFELKSAHDKRLQLIANAKAVVSENQGVTEKNLELIKSYL